MVALRCPHFGHQVVTISGFYPFVDVVAGGRQSRSPSTAQAGVFVRCDNRVSGLRGASKSVLLKLREQSECLANRLQRLRVTQRLRGCRVRGSIGNGRRRSPLLCRPCRLWSEVSPAIQKIGFRQDRSRCCTETLPKRAAARVPISTLLLRLRCLKVSRVVPECVD